MSKKKKLITLSTHKAIYGLLFSLPFIIGFIVFFLFPFIFFLILGFSKMTLTVRGMEVVFNGLDNFKELFTTKANFINIIIDNVKSIVLKVPSVLLFSFFIAIILNEKFKGRFLARAIFFLPVIIASGALGILNTDHLSIQAQAVVTGMDENVYVGTNGLYGKIISLFGQNSLSSELIDVVDKIVWSVGFIVNASGVQILIFLAGLQTISMSLYEASRIDGASSWENFWKITLPILSPIVLVNAAYTIIDCLAAPDNVAIKEIYDTAAYETNYSISSSMSIIYFLIIFVLLGFTMYFISKRVYYEDR